MNVKKSKLLFPLSLLQLPHIYLKLFFEKEIKKPFDSVCNLTVFCYYNIYLFNFPQKTPRHFVHIILYVLHIR
jgi:hypothetical protein